jgi:NADH-quinone oxidoreductase subunit C/D
MREITPPVPPGGWIPDPRIPPELQGVLELTTWEKLINRLDGLYSWGRRRSLWPVAFGLACCAIEMIGTATARFDISRFGMELFRASPRQADVLIANGTMTKKMAPQVVRIYNQIPEPKYVIAMGSCAISGGPFKEGYNVVAGVDKLLPVDVYIPGCPPTPQALLHGILQLHKKIDSQHITQMPWYSKKYDLPEYPVPLLGPDLIDVRRMDEIAEAGRAYQPEVEAEAAAPQEKPVIVFAPVSEEALAADETLAYFEAHFPGAVVPADREGHEGYVVRAECLLEVAQHIRDEMGYDYLSSVTAVDYAQDGYFEMVYHAYSMERGGGPLVFKARAAAHDPVLPSLTPLWPGAEFQEREAWDLMGVRFEGHPDLRRIFLWEGFDGHPLRKDWKEAFYEEETKPFKSRTAGKPVSAEERSRWGDNVRYPAGYVPDGSNSEADPMIYSALQSLRDNGHQGDLVTEPVIVNMGPQHPSTHGVFRMALKLDGETIVDLKPVMGYLHRNHEKIGERNTWIANIPFTDRLDYITSMSNNFGYVLAVEKLLGVEIPERADYLRVIMAEFTRILNHALAIGFLFNDLGAFMTPVVYAFEERELIMDLFEMVSGSRMMCNYYRFGGVVRDVTPEFMTKAHQMVKERLPRAVDMLHTFLTENEIFRARSLGVGLLPPERAIALSVTGPLLRASGVPYDVRRAEPYSIYDRFDFDVVTHNGCDVYARYMVRLEEMRQSLRILRQALDQMPEGPIMGGRGGYSFRVPAGDAYARIESPKGELGYYLVSAGKVNNPYRYHVRPATFINLGSLAGMCRGAKVADTVVIFGSIDITLGEVDR